MTNSFQPDRNAEIREANSCMALGAGLGAVGTGTAFLAGVTCPLCFMIAPALIGYGVWKRVTAQRGACRESADKLCIPEKSESAD
ncbi:hypothetical protein Spb1_37970 [Planctopirus ephydatiae]|jgi:hypothetical protein|uniref:Uncharacterized protein n=1 Tax=Planctopirus ephydatiae TaxID=2528019 RepID=A0A518GTD5_9PLAN|nr:hypothetical protein [Planctopirus ephydatiae]QDV31851.1 hypothetical protein Spb1_37970 [Planctopirus ephydatiae]